MWEAEDCYARLLTIPCNRAQRFGGKITTKFKSLPLDNVSEVSEEIKFWETDEYHDNFYKAIRGEMEKDEFDIKFPDGIQVWPDGVKYHTRVISSILEEVTLVTPEPAWADSDSNINNLSNEVTENIAEAMNENSQCDNTKQFCNILGEVTLVTPEPAWADSTIIPDTLLKTVEDIASPSNVDQLDSVVGEVTLVPVEPSFADSNEVLNEISENISEAVNENSECDNTKQFCSILGEVVAVTPEPAWAD